MSKKKKKTTAKKKIHRSKQPAQSNLSKQGKPICMADTQHDIALRKQHEEQLQIYKNITSLTNDCLSYVDKDLIFHEVNDAYLKAFHLNRDQVIGHHVKKVHGKEHCENWIKFLLERCLAGQAVKTDTEIVMPDGKRFLNVRVDPYIGENGKILGATTSITDITEYKRVVNSLEQSESRSHEAQQIAHLGFWEWILKTDYLYWSDETYNIVNVKKGETEPTLQLFIDMLHPDDKAYVNEALQNALSNSEPYDINYRIIPSDGKIRHLHAQGQVDYDSDGKPVRMYGTVMDVSETRFAEEALRSSEERYRALFDDNPTMIFTLDLDGKVISLNRFGVQQLGYSEEQLIGNHIEKIFYEPDIPLVKKWIQLCIDEPDVIHRWEIRKIRADGNILWVRETARLVRDIEGIQTILIVCEDITETRELSEQLSYQASHDALTGLINRREFEHRLHRILETAKLNQSEHALCYLDLDQFKIINDTCGHVAGDELLSQIGTLLQSDVRQRDTLARLGGDEFGVLMEHCSLEHAERVANKFRKSIEEYKFAWEDRSFPIGVSIGLVPISNTSVSTIELLKQADAACYAAKDMGRNRIHVYHEDDVELARRYGEMQWVSRINRALEQDQFRLFIQRIVPLRKKQRGEHYELLLRMEDENQNFILPGAFLPAAERYNLSTQIDRWVFDSYIDKLLKYPEHLNKLFQCSINLSGLSLGDDEFLNYLVMRFDETNISPDKICFEITETAAITNFSSAARFIQTLKEKGCCFSLDDFGSGLSSFAYLKNLPVDYLKIDGVFIKDIDSDPIDLAMVKSISDIGKVMGKLIIAEFVESKAILRMVKRMGIDYAQGYEIGKPQPIESILD